MNATAVPEVVLNEVATLLKTDVATIQAKWPAYAASIEKCDACGRELDFFDFVKTAFDSGTHSRDYMVNFFLGSKAMEKELSTTINCSSCGKAHQAHVMYKYQGPHTCS